MNKITAQEIIQAVKEIQGAAVGISRTNQPLFRNITNKCTELEKRIIASCDNIVLANDDFMVSVSDLEKVLAESSSAEEEHHGIVDLIEEANGVKASKAEAKAQEEAAATAEAIKAATTGEGNEPTGKINTVGGGDAPPVDVESQHESDEDLLAAATPKKEANAPKSGSIADAMKAAKQK